MRIEIEVELSEKAESTNRAETRRFSRNVEMDLPAIGHEIELNVDGEPVMVLVTDATRNAEDGLYHVRVEGQSLTVKALREDERWTETIV